MRLHPSAMHYMGGFLEGVPKTLNDKSYELLIQQDGYFIRVKIIKLKIHLDFPLTPKINENGVRDFINEVENGIIHIHKVWLEGLIEYHYAGFETIDDYYYNEGNNNNTNHVVEDLYNLRAKMKNIKIQHRLLLNG